MTFRPGRQALADWLVNVAASDPAALTPASGNSAGGVTAENIEQSGLDMRTHALVQIAALVTAGEPGMVFDEHIAAALDRGVTPDEIVGVVVALLPMAGRARIAATAPTVLGAIDRVAAGVPASPEA